MGDRLKGRGHRQRKVVHPKLRSCLMMASVARVGEVSASVSCVKRRARSASSCGVG